MYPDHPGLFFIGLLQPVGAVMPLAEAQANWVAEILTGVYRFSSDTVIRWEMRRAHERYRKRFYDSPRHTMEVDFDRYLWELGRERTCGKPRPGGASHTPGARCGGG